MVLFLWVIFKHKRSVSAFIIDCDGLVLKVVYSIYSATVILKGCAWYLEIVCNSRMVLSWWCGWWVFLGSMSAFCLKFMSFIAVFEGFLGLGLE